MNTISDYKLVTDNINCSGYWVYGGEYVDTRFQDIKIGTEQVEGPYHTYQEAFNEWRKLSFLNVDNCHYRFTVYHH
jgi:hypothetical protein